MRFAFAVGVVMVTVALGASAVVNSQEGGSRAPAARAATAKPYTPPKTPWGESGPYEQSVLNTVLVESNYKDPSGFKGIDILRAIRSFDPCMPCTTHVMVEGSDRVITREVTTCACGI